ncbi:hypothetical protein HanHA300_Chr14g0518351 [Helianthus annuus]|nr:hypothetical protein HanHA300_Chr14g0518351 [Helianthus annuus]
MPQYEGSSADYDTNPFVQPQQYSLQGYPTNAKERFPHFFELRELIMNCVRIIKEFRKCGDPRFPKMVGILDRMIGQIGPMIECDLSRQRDPRCEECGGPHWYEECAIAARLEMGWGNREQKQQIQWGDYDDEWITVQSSYYKAIVIPELADGETIWGYVVSKAEKVEVEREEEEEVEVEQPSNEDQMTWENEFKEELDGLPVDEEVKEFDPQGDLAYLEVLLEGNPMTDIKEEEVVVEEEEHHSWPLVLVLSEAEKSTTPRERAKKRKIKDLNRKRIEGWGEMERKKPFTNDRSSHYMSRIRSLPGMFKFWWSDPFENFKIFYYSTIIFLNIFEYQVELNGLDRVQIKEKPPD